jgi:hypothetical protein
MSEEFRACWYCEKPAAGFGIQGVPGGLCETHAQGYVMFLRDRGIDPADKAYWNTEMIGKWWIGARRAVAV